MEQKLPFCTWLFTILPSFAAVLCHQTMSNPWGFSCMTPINFNQSQENKLLSKALWKWTPPFLTIILTCFVWWAIFGRESLNAASFQYLLFVRKEISTVCSLLPIAVNTDFTTQMTKWLTSAFLSMKQIQIFQGYISCVLQDGKTV